MRRARPLQRFFAAASLLITGLVGGVLVVACGAGNPTHPDHDGGAGAAGSGGGAPDGGVSSGSSSGSGTGGGGPGCGYQGMGTPLHVADNIDVCLPPVVCTSETCPPPLGQCVSGKCVFSNGYKGLLTLPEAWATHYCALSMGGCHGVTQIEFPEVTAQAIGQKLGHPLCDNAKPGDSECIGIMASAPMIVGNSQEARDPVTNKLVTAWGLGMTEASGLCYEITGPGGTAVVAVTDRCGGYCKCNGSGFQECGPCVNAPTMVPNCPCVGTAPSLYGECCGLGCPTTKADCDWCASNNHPHYDLDDSTFNWVCGPKAINGSCQLSAVHYVPCLKPKAWPPGGGGGGCGANSFQCNGAPAAHQDLVPNTTCCCNYNQCPQPDSSCGPPPASCKAGSCACGAGQPDADHPKVPSTGCCCVYGAQPQADGTCQ